MYRGISPGAPFLPRYDTKYIEDAELNITTAIRHYFDALDMRALAHKMGAIFGGKLPHASTLVPGGVTEKVTALKIAACKSIINKLQEFIDNSYLSDVSELAGAFPEYLQIGKGCGNFLAYGVFPESGDHSAKLFPDGVIMEKKLGYFDPAVITEDVLYSHYSSPSNLKPAQGRTIPDPKKSNAYSWIKAPRYNKAVMETGPLARIMVAYLKGKNPQVKKLADNFLGRFDAGIEILDSCLGRHAARAVECKIIADRCSEWIEELRPGKTAFQDFDIPESGEGAGLTEAPRGALGHWIKIKEHKTDNYQCVVPTTWNCSPRDDRGNPGLLNRRLWGRRFLTIKIRQRQLVWCVLLIRALLVQFISLFGHPSYMLESSLHFPEL
ncbi:MAG: nickel-dependent hydrogenase large subunit [Desulfobacteraceae bacterium]|nr:nickel-dependent hydrogenase large subunit [Desulfobacteraceae bacterium]